ncbi:MAG: hypothetical protein L6R39_005086 [Caloplaca ligustica]|nr:MAG: hypothetical protein L6R39_005086 [Caloplaca ligustica]
MNHWRSSYLCGCGYYVGHEKRYLPQVQLNTHATILSDTSRTTLKQTFSNPSSDNVKQCTYMFPLYDGVSVVAFTCRIGSRLLRGAVQERGQAKATFDAAVSRGETAAYLEQLPDASDVFSSRLGNIPANEKVHVEITYVGELKHDAEADGIRFTIPTHIAPRYGTISSTQYATGSTAVEKGGIKITIDASVAEGSFIRGIQSPTHPIAVSMGATSTSSDVEVAMHKASATLSLGTTELDKDFVLIVLTKDTGTPKALLETHPTIPNQQALMLTLVPKFSLPRSNPEIIFVADRSGSMGGKIPTLKSALNVFLKSLPVGVRFNICSFGSTYSFLWPKSQAYSRETLDKALSHVRTFGANYGGTETYAALRAAISNRFPDMPCEVMLLTDGAIWNQAQLFTFLNDEVKNSKSSLRVFALGIGDGVSHALVEGVARAGNGFAQTVKEDERLDSKVIRMLKGGLSPHTTDYSLEVTYHDEKADEDSEIVEKVTDSLSVLLSEERPAAEPGREKENKPISFFDPNSAQSGQEKPPSAENDGIEPFAHLPAISVPKIIQTPQVIPSLFPFSRTSVYLLFSDNATHKTPKSVTLRAKSEHGPLELEIPIEILGTPNETIHQLAARKAIQELEEGRGWIYEAKGTDGNESLLKDRYASRFDEFVQREGVRLGVRYQVGGKWTSFVAVKDKNHTKHRSQESGGPTLDTPEAGTTDESDACGLGQAFGRVDSDDETMGSDLFGDTVASPHSSQPRYEGSHALTLSADRRDSIHAHRAFMPAFSSSQQTQQQQCMTAPTGNAAPSSRAYMVQGSMDATGGPLLPQAKRRSRRSGGPSIGGMPSLVGAAGGLFSSGQRSTNATLAFQSFARDSAPAAPKTDTNAKKRAYEPAAPAAPETDNEKVHAVIGMQDFEGWWEQSRALLAILEIAVSGSRGKEWVTMLVVRWLEVKMKGEKDVWELVVEKARGWLEAQIMGEGEMGRLEREVDGYVR